MRTFLAPLAMLAGALTPAGAAAQPHRALLPIDFASSAEFRWLGKTVLDSRTLDDMSRPPTWTMSGTGRLSFPTEPRLDGMRVLHVDMELFGGQRAPTPNGLSAVTLRRGFDGE